MIGLFFSITLSVTLLAIVFLTLKGKLVKIYGAKVIYILSLLMAIRLLIPYSIQLPDVARFTIYVPKFLPILWAIGTLTSIALQIGRYIYTKNRLIGMSDPVDDAKLLRQYQDVVQKISAFNNSHRRSCFDNAFPAKCIYQKSIFLHLHTVPDILYV